jgi:OmpA-OmpF porin, OOP family
MIYRKLLLSATLTSLSFAASFAFASVPVAGTVGDVPFPSKESSYLSKGHFVNIENLRQIKRDLSKDQVRLLLGNPHFKEGIVGSKEWNYIFNFHTGAGEEFITCQYQVRYAKNPSYTVQSTHWDGPACLELLSKPEALAHAATAPVDVSVSADALFAFGRYDVDDILPDGRNELSAIAEQLKDLDQVRVLGHTDRIGSDAANQLLSQRRAETVREYLISRSVSANSITAEGRGEREPVKDCDNAMSRENLIACLAPNRRVHITAAGTRTVE